MLEFLKGLPRAVLFVLVGAALAVYLTGYATAWSARQHGFEAEFSDYGLLKKISAPEPMRAKNCREMRLSYDAQQQALVAQVRAFDEREASANQAISNILKEYAPARQYDEIKNQTWYNGSSSSIILSEVESIRNSITSDHSTESQLRQNLAIAYNNLSNLCFQTAPGASAK